MTNFKIGKKKNVFNIGLGIEPTNFGFYLIPIKKVRVQSPTFYFLKERFQTIRMGSDILIFGYCCADLGRFTYYF